VFEIDHTDPEVRRIVAQYEDLTAQFQHTANDIEAEHEESAKAIQDAAEQRQKDSAEFYEQFEKAEREAQEADPSPWTAPREVKESVMSFGDFDGEKSASTWSAPTPPMGFLPPPPIPEPVPEPEAFRGPATQPLMSFGEFEDDEPIREQPAPPPVPPGSGRRRLREDDDDDLSGQSWLS
jgi:hypothetical protein